MGQGATGARLPPFPVWARRLQGAPGSTLHVVPSALRRSPAGLPLPPPETPAEPPAAAAAAPAAPQGGATAAAQAAAPVRRPQRRAVPDLLRCADVEDDPAVARADDDEGKEEAKHEAEEEVVEAVVLEPELLADATRVVAPLGGALHVDELVGLGDEAEEKHGHDE